MNNFIDTHTHLYDEQFATDLEAMVERAIHAGVNRMYMPNCDSNTIGPMLAIADKWPQHCFPMMGLHPVYVKENYQDELALVSEWLGKREFYAVGEIGLDKYWDQSFLPQQVEAFSTQIDWALHHNLPIVIHSREATRDCIDIVKGKQDGNLRGIFHCFSGSVEEAKAVVDCGLKLGIGGVVTFKKSNLPEVITAVGMEHLVLETDAPYLAPVPYRGKRNESSYIPIIASQVAGILQVDVEAVAMHTAANAEIIFGKSLK